MTDPTPLITMLKEFRDRLNVIFEHSSDLIIFTDTRGRVTQMNPTAVNRLGQPQTADELSIKNFIYTTSHTHHEMLCKKLLAGEEIPDQIQIALISKYNQLLMVEGTISYKHDPVSNVGEFHYILHDLSQQKWEQYQYQEQTLRNQELYQIATADNLSLAGKIHIMLDTCSALLNMRDAYVAELDNQYLRIRYIVSESSNFLHVSQRVELRETFDNLTLKANDIFSIRDVVTTQYVNHRAYKHHGLRSYIGIPLYLNNHVYGVLAFSHADPANRDFSMYDIDFIRLIGQWISSFLTRERLREVIHLQAQRISVLTALENVGLYESDFAGNLKTFNKRLCEISGKKPRDLQLYGHRAYLDEDSTKRLYQAFANVSQSGVSITNLNCSFKRDDQVYSVQISIYLLTDPEGKAIGFIGSVSEVT